MGREYTVARTIWCLLLFLLPVYASIIYLIAR